MDRRLPALCALAFTILASYEVARPAAESLFLTRHDYTALPDVWVFVALACVVTVAVYNRVVARFALHQVLLACALFTAAALAVVRLAFDADVPYSAYALYVWKDVYIVVLVEVFWTYANATYPLKQARWVYGAFLALGSLGAIVGARLVGWLSTTVGTADALWAVVPLMLLVAGLALVLGAPERQTKERPPSPRFADGVRMLMASRYLGLMLLLILAVQVVVTLVDYQFNAIVGTTYAGEAQQDARTAVIASVYEWIGWGALTMQVLSGPLLKLLGVGGALVTVPLVAIGAALALLISPVFAFAAVAKVSGKVLDYSLFRAAKELLYLPLPYAEKTQGKAFVDILTYRVAKGGVALLLKAVIAFGFAAVVGAVTVAVALAWLGISVAIMRRYRQVA